MRAELLYQLIHVMLTPNRHYWTGALGILICKSNPQHDAIEDLTTVARHAQLLLLCGDLEPVD